MTATPDADPPEPRSPSPRPRRLLGERLRCRVSEAAGQVGGHAEEKVGEASRVIATLVRS
ncbi:hypothetical protein OG275_00645 [Streptomyces niveus]|uniref:hypothetical protein n=1 Tax=Streptomyces niveus TaxID=193462 RepID=UPI002E2F2178|nr:hypothetical protein [Streptomyces niveus]